MKRLWIGVGVLLTLLALGLGSTAAMEGIPGKLAQDMDKAAEVAATQWEKAKSLAASAREKWNQYEHVIASLTDHEALEELKGLFSELDVSQLWEDREHFAAVCARIASLAEAVSESQTPHWWNLL